MFIACKLKLSLPKVMLNKVWLFLKLGLVNYEFTTQPLLCQNKLLKAHFSQV
jgi:hypothetical protein